MAALVSVDPHASTSSIPNRSENVAICRAEPADASARVTW